jgi:hypothetical protein
LRAAGTEWELVRCLVFDDAVLAFWDNELIPFIQREGLPAVIAMKPILTGKEIAELHHVALGPRVAQLLDGLIEWQILHPGEKREEYTRYVSGD